MALLGSAFATADSAYVIRGSGCGRERGEADLRKSEREHLEEETMRFVNVSTACPVSGALESIRAYPTKYTTSSTYYYCIPPLHSLDLVQQRHADPKRRVVRVLLQTGRVNGNIEDIQDKTR